MFDWYARDIAGFFIALSLFPVVLLLPGALLFKVAFPADRPETSIERRLGLSLLCGFAAWPVVLALVGLVDVRAMTLATVLAALAGARLLLRTAPRFTLSFPLGAAAAVLALATAAALVQSLPWPTADGFLHHSVVWDAQKHAAVTRMILETGIPPHNLNWTLEAPDTGLPPLGYYYQFCTLPAVVALLSGGTVEARHAIFAVQPWLMLAFYVLILEVLRSIAPGSPQPRLRCAAAGALLFAGGFGSELMRPNGIWTTHNDHLLTFLLGVSWVPQHFVAGLSAVFGLVVLARASAAADETRPPFARVALGLLSAMALSNALASSVPVGTAAAAAGCLFFAAAAVRRDIRTARFAVAVGTAAVVIALPVLLTLLATHGTVHGDGGIIFSVRNPAIIAATSDPLFTPLNLLFFYTVYFGIFALGAVICLSMFRSRLRSSPELAMLGMTAAASLLVASLVKSNVIDNDFGWRAVIPALIVLAAWTVVVIENLTGNRPFLRQAFVFAFMLGIAETFISTTLTLHPGEDNLPPRNSGFPLLWAEIDRRTLPEAVVQLRPRLEPYTADDYYRTRPTAMADVHHAIVFGRSNPEAFERRDSLDQLFADTNLLPNEAREIARRFRIDFVVVENIDPVWNAPEAWPQTMRPHFETPQFRVYDMRDGASPAP